jgi:hypothetical protein
MKIAMGPQPIYIPASYSSLGRCWNGRSEGVIPGLWVGASAVKQGLSTCLNCESQDDISNSRHIVRAIDPVWPILRHA